MIKPCKPKLGKVSKQLLDPIISTVKEKSGLLQFKNTVSVLQWFQPIQNKDIYKWIIFDLVDYYPSISEKLLTDALDWAQNFIPIDEKTKNIILHVRKTFLYYKGRAWVKRSDPEWDVTMGSFDSAEVADLVSLFLLSHIEHLPVKSGIFKDDGICLSDLSANETENVRQEICRMASVAKLRLTRRLHIISMSLSILQKGSIAHTESPTTSPSTSTHSLIIHRRSRSRCLLKSTDGSMSSTVMKQLLMFRPRCIKML